ncbi:MAG: hypothetical protein WC609_01840 [Candidatus Paceibacterota bacterium]|jgi:hypothetical protein
MGIINGMTKHFLKTLTVFMFMIILGLIGVYFVTYLENSETIKNNVNPDTEIAK